MRVLRLVSGIVLVCAAAFMTLGFALSDNRHDSAVVLILATGLTIVLPGVVGVRLLRPFVGRQPDLAVAHPLAGIPPLEPAPSLEATLVRLAERLGGRLTVIEVVRETGMGADASESALSKLVEEGLAEPEVTDDGLMVYVVKDLELLKRKSQSRGVLED